jgi:hypothetical protein
MTACKVRDRLRLRAMRVCDQGLLGGLVLPHLMEASITGGAKILLGARAARFGARFIDATVSCLCSPVGEGAFRGHGSWRTARSKRLHQVHRGRRAIVERTCAASLAMVGCVHEAVVVKVHITVEASALEELANAYGQTDVRQNSRLW